MSDQDLEPEQRSGAAPTLTVAAVARRLGVAPATLRTWARRYGLGPTSHTAGSHRRYTSEDFARLAIMRRLTHEGVSPAEAARMAIEDPDPQPDDGPRRSGPLGLVHDDDEFGDDLRRPVRLPESAPAVRGLARAAMALDANGITEVLRRQVRADGVVATWDTLCVPVLIGLGERFAATGEGVEAEHLFSECVMGVLRATSDRLTQPRNTAPILLACLDEEQHSLPLHAVAAALAERGIAARQARHAGTDRRAVGGHPPHRPGRRPALRRDARGVGRRPAGADPRAALAAHPGRRQRLAARRAALRAARRLHRPRGVRARRRRRLTAPHRPASGRRPSPSPAARSASRPRRHPRAFPSAPPPCCRCMTCWWSSRAPAATEGTTEHVDGDGVRRLAPGARDDASQRGHGARCDAGAGCCER
nr:MerR family transcriptional regulator [Angustibacter aerolatus]